MQVGDGRSCVWDAMLTSPPRAEVGQQAAMRELSVLAALTAHNAEGSFVAGLVRRGKLRREGVVLRDWHDVYGVLPDGMHPFGPQGRPLAPQAGLAMPVASVAPRFGHALRGLLCFATPRPAPPLCIPSLSVRDAFREHWQAEAYKADKGAKPSILPRGRRRVAHAVCRVAQARAPSPALSARPVDLASLSIGAPLLAR